MPWRSLWRGFSQPESDAGVLPFVPASTAWAGSHGDVLKILLLRTVVVILVVTPYSPPLWLTFCCDNNP